MSLHLEIINLLNQASDEFCQRTLILDEATKFNTVANQRYYGYEEKEKNLIFKKLEEAIKTDYHRYFCPDGFFWGQQFQEESMREYREQDEEFLKECKKALELGEPLTYECSW